MAKPSTAQQRQRAHRGQTRVRMAGYPIADWLGSALTPDSTEVTFWTATKDEDFPTISRPHFVQDLHQLAREATQRAAIDQEELGYVVRTTTQDFDAEHPVGLDELGFWFIRFPIAECPSTRKDHTNQGRRPTSAGVATPEWRRLRYANTYCNAAGTGWHTLGSSSLSVCPRCDGLSPVDIGPTPPAGWVYGAAPITGAWPFLTAPEDYPLAPA